MANKNKRLSQNVVGPFFVDASCINCGSCWQIAPKNFSQTNANTAFVHKQPIQEKEIYKAILALTDCPVGAIGAPTDIISNVSNNIFPIFVAKNFAGEVYYCGWSSSLSFGASSWLIVRPEGNILIDSPRWSTSLAKTIDKMGRIDQMVLTHRDDVADHAKWSKAFKCERWIHKDDMDAAPESENQLIGMDLISIGNQITLIPVPGHTKGSIVAVLGDQKQILFSGDHLWWNPKKEVLVASKEYCWWNWTEQLKSVKRLLNLDVRWLLPGHGYAKQFEPGEWKKAVEQTLEYEKKHKNLL
ncbi:MBL fold metallo-hydrolase [Prochlorococcus marinus]|uniref:MBL fold metallo-hydrolase n=1 Tax=Prochlorococcus marinus TaxID=1219 RepID=UPI0022B3599E|nr:MBL fold metallo-hydrolase [Prochlorococcus marinus]